MSKPQTIQVRRYCEGQTMYGRYGGPISDFGMHDVLETISRKLYVDSVGNFNRVACRYHGKTYIVHSEKGDIGDPFRADESYLTCLYIDANSPCQWNLK